MPMNDEFSKHGWKFVAGFVAVVLVTITTLFFYTGSIMSGLIMTAILALLLVSASRKDRRDLQIRNANLEYNRQNSQDAARASELAADQPPSYRLTWRRSFIKKFKNLTNQDTQTSEESSPNLEVVTTISGNIASHTADEPITPVQQETPSITLDPVTSVAVNNEISDNNSDEGLPSFEEATDVSRSYLKELMARDLITSNQLFFA